MLRKHCTDEQLIAALDNELRSRHMRRVASHLAGCWACRARQSELEQQIYAIEGAARKELYPGPEWSARAKRRFSASASELEPRFALEARWWHIPSGLRWPAVALASAVALLFAVYPNWLEWSVRGKAQAQIDRFVEADRAVARAPMHQVLLVEMRQPRKPREMRNLELEVWSDPQASRHALRVRDEAKLLHAAWRSSADERGTTPDFPQVRNPEPPLADLLQEQWTAEEAEAEFVSWIGSRVWQPVAFSGDFQRFASSAGATLTVEQVNAKTVRITASRQQLTVSTQWMVEIDEGTNRPAIQSIRWQRPSMEMEMQVVTEREETLNAALISPDIFESPIPLVVPPLPPVVPETSTLSPVVPLRPTPVDLAAAGIQAEYALHRLPLEWVSALEVLEESYKVTVRGVTETAEMRKSIEAALSAFPWVVADVESVEEAPPAEQSAGETVLLDLPQTEQVFPLEEALHAYFNSDGDREAAARRAADFARDATQLSSRILEESWALRRLAERYPAERVDAVPLETRWLLEELKDSHLRTLGEARSALQNRLVPVLGPLAMATPPESESPDALDPADEAGAEDELLQAANTVDRQIRGLLAGGRLDDDRPEIAVQRLLDTIDAMERSVVRIASASQNSTARPESTRQ